MTQGDIAPQGCAGPSLVLFTKLTENGVSRVLDLSQITDFVDVIILPLLASMALILAKFSRGEAARWAERHFFGVLVVFTIVTLRTVITCDEVWLVHTTTLGTLIVAALVIPGHETSIAV